MNPVEKVEELIALCNEMSINPFDLQMTPAACTIINVLIERIALLESYVNPEGTEK